jgi:hypothetical protein
MPATWNGMQRILMQGVPVWKAADGSLFAYDSDLTQPLLPIGNGTEFSATWRDTYADRLAAYRDSSKARVRLTNATQKK